MRAKESEMNKEMDDSEPRVLKRGNKNNKNLVGCSGVGIRKNTKCIGSGFVQ